MIKFLDPVSFNLINPIQVFQWILIVRRRVLRVCYSFLQKKEVPLNLDEILITPRLTKAEITVEGLLTNCMLKI